MRNIILISLTILLFSNCKKEKKNESGLNTEKRVDVFTPIRELKQPKNMDCWATALTILYSYKSSNESILIEDVLKKYGQEYVDMFKNNSGISPVDEKVLYNIAGLKIIEGLNPSIEGWKNLLKSKGPLSITVDAKPPNNWIHALVLNGLIGDGEPNTTFVYYVDPADGKQHSKTFTDFLKLYEGSANWPLQIIHW